MKMVLTVIALLCVATSSFASEWQNLITCDEGIRIDLQDGWKRQIVLYGPALQHFVNAGAVSIHLINPAGEFVSPLQTYDDYFIATLHDGGLVVLSELNAKVSTLKVVWQRYQNNPGTGFIFNACH